jgi:hypothetical protein
MVHNYFMYYVMYSTRRSIEQNERIKKLKIKDKILGTLRSEVVLFLPAYYALIFNNIIIIISSCVLLCLSLYLYSVTGGDHHILARDIR